MVQRFHDRDRIQFWEIWREPEEMFTNLHNVWTRTGEIGCPAESGRRQFTTEAKAIAHVESRIAEQRAAGFEPATAEPEQPFQAVRNLELEQQLLENPADELFAVYADWLAERGDPRGELAALQTQFAVTGDHRLDRRAQHLLRRYREHFFGPLAELIFSVQATWYHGWMDTLTLRPSGGDDLPRIHDLIGGLPALDSARFLRGLTIESESYDVPGPVDVTCIAPIIPALPLLRMVALGDTAIEESKFDDLDPLWRVAGQLEQLTLRAGTVDLGSIEVPNLRALIVDELHPSTRTIEAVARAPWPNLERLELCIADPADLVHLFANELPALQELRIDNLGDRAGLLEQLARWPGLARLRTLELGDVELEGDAFAHLREVIDG